jgi:hypothetical protein
MKLRIENVFAGIDVYAYEALYFDEAFNDALGRALQLGRKLVHFERSPHRIVRHVQFEPIQPDDAPVKQAFGSSRASFIEELDYDVRARRGAWRTIPNMWSERVSNAGTIEFASASGGTRRTVHGEVKVSLFGFGRVVEKMIVAEIEKSYASTTKFTNDWLAQKK